VNAIEPDPIGEAPVCTDWYWVTTYFYEDGHTETESSLAFTICETPTSGGGGGSTGEDDECTNSMSTALAGTAVSEVGEGLLFRESSTERSKMYNWVIYRQNQGMWRFEAPQLGKHVKVNNVWKWKSLEHTGIQMVGSIYGGTITATTDATAPYIGEYFAGQLLYYRIKYSVACKGSPIESETPQKTAQATFGLGN
jgi:hypothetical protein